MAFAEANLIAFTGLKGSGKDTAARALQPPLRDWIKVAFADTLRDVVKVAYGLTDRELNDRDLKEKQLDRFPFKSPRQILQVVGTEMFRNNIPGTWVQAWKRKTRGLLQAGECVVVTDFRFPDEADAIRELGGTLIRINRAGHSHTDLHESERHIPNLPVDFEIVNDAPSASNFIVNVIDRLKAEGLIL